MTAQPDITSSSPSPSPAVSPGTRAANAELVSTRPATGAPPLRRAGELLVWTTLIAAGARRHGLLGWAAVAYGLEKLSKVAFGTPLSRLLLRALPKRPRERRFGDGTRDIVDEASWESFPASDPPARGIG